MVTRYNDVLKQYEAIAPLDGVVTNLPVRVGETVVPGIQNSTASTIMTIADMSIITAEVHVDETDIVSVKLDQPAEVTIDAIPNQTFKGKVIEIGDTAIVRSTGVAASQSQTSSQEAKDFKVVIALDISEDLGPSRPFVHGEDHNGGASAYTGDSDSSANHPSEGTTAARKARPSARDRSRGVEGGERRDCKASLSSQGGKAVFREVKTGISGSTDIEVLPGELKEGDEIVTGSYQVIRTIRNDAKVKMDNKPPAVSTTPS